MHEEDISEKLDLDDPAGNHIHSIVHSKHDRFKGMNRAKRVQLGLGMFYHHRNKAMMGMRGNK